MASIRALPGGKRSQVSWYDSNGVRHRVAKPKKQAQVLCDQVTAQALFEKTGLSPAGAGQKANSFRELQFQQIAERYGDEHLAHTRAKSNSNYVNTLIEKWGAYRLPMITHELVRPWLFTYLRQPINGKRWKVSSVKKLTRYFIRVFNWAMEMEIIDRNPLAKVINDGLKKEFKRITKRSKTITPEEFWKDLIVGFPLWLRRVSICAWCAGMREDEVICLRRRDYNLLSRLITLQPDATKEADTKKIGIEQELYDVLIEIETERPNMMPDDFVFLSVRGRQIDQRFLCRKFRKYADAAGFRDLKFHDFRHCYTVRKRREGHSKSVIRAQTGHKTDSMFTWYDKVDDFEIQEMAGFSDVGLEILDDDIHALVEKALSKGIPLGAVQSLVGRTWQSRSLQKGAQVREDQKCAA